jgi:hypothetical protein
MYQRNLYTGKNKAFFFLWITYLDKPGADGKTLSPFIIEYIKKNTKNNSKLNIIRSKYFAFTLLSVFKEQALKKTKNRWFFYI